MNHIYKYPIPTAKRAVVEVPKDAVLLSVGLQGLYLQGWFLVNTEKPLVKHSFSTYVTGEPYDDNPLDYFSTIQTGDGRHQLVLHVFYHGEQGVLP